MSLQQREVIITNDAPVPVGLEAPAVAATGSITCGQVADGNTVTIDDGVHTAVTFEFDDNETTTEGNVAVAFAASGSVSAANLLAAINAQAALDITAAPTDPASATINLTNDTAGAAGNVSITKVGAPITVAGMSGGLDAVDLYTIQDALGNISISFEGDVAIDNVGIASIAPGDNNIGNVDVLTLPALPAGTNNIGDVDVLTLPALPAGTNNIGDVDIASFPTVTLTTVSSLCNSAGPNSVVAAPSAGNHHVLHAFQLQVKGAPVTLQVVLLKSDTTQMWSYSSTVVNGGIYIEFPPGQELHWGSAKAIVLDLAEAKDVAYVLRYRTIAD